MKGPRVFLMVGVIVLVFLGCGSGEVTREQWEAMSAAERELVVKSFLGGETAAAAKGGEGRRYSKEAGDYVAAIDAAYAGGDTRTVEKIWPELSDQG